MRLANELKQMRQQFGLLTFYQKFEQVCVMALTTLIAIVIVFALWHLGINVLSAVINNTFDPTDYAVFQTVFGMIFTVIIALEFKRSLLVVAERRDSIVQVRAVVLIALLAVVRKLIILDLSHTEALQLFALAASMLALGGVYWLVSDQESRRRRANLQSASADRPEPAAP
ncbi:MAG TPA: phosphate-starvation-inducible PsiE family protein [Pseudolabrys sp.]|nr:phosphate-starvation-inducible PsiE family protein [Pseudolabrys sp.]